MGRWIALLTPLVILAGIAFWTQYELERVPRPALRPAQGASAVVAVAVPDRVPVAAPAPEQDPEVLMPEGKKSKWDVHNSIVPMPDGEAIAPRELATLAALDPLMPLALRTQLAGKIAALKCDSARLTLYERQGSASRLIVSDCWRVRFEPTRNPPSIQDEQYHAMWVWDDRGLQDVLALDQAFGHMYLSGGLSGVTDLNRNGQLELWLTGTKYECGEDEEPCDAEGLWIVEVSGRRLQLLDPVRLLAPPQAPQ